MSTSAEIQAQITATENAITQIKKQLDAAKHGSNEQTQLSISLYDLRKQLNVLKAKQSAKQTIKNNTPPAPEAEDEHQKSNTDTTGSVDVVTNGGGVGLPNRRQYNPLGDFSSYNYQLSLYLATPEATNRFIKSGMTQVGNAIDNNGAISDGFYLVAQSGGINNEAGDLPGGNKRAPGFDLDFYIDDLKFKTYSTLKASESASAQSAEFEFNIYEPYGLSFTSRLTTAAKAIQSSSNLPGFEGEANALGQFYILGLRFYGYDKNGEVVTADQYQGSDASSTKTDKQALFERFYSLKIKSFKFKLDGKMPVYNIQAVALSMVESFGSKRGQVGSNATLTGATVSEMLKGKHGLITKLNKEESDAADKRRKEAQKSNKSVNVVANSYDVRFEPNSGIEDALMVDPKDFAKYKTNIAMGDVKNTKDSNPASEGKAATNKGKKTLTITSGTHMVAAVEQVIKQSSYIKDMMKTVDTALSEEDPAVNGNPAEVAWFSITPGIEILGYDTVLNDYAYKITYYIQRYIVPFVRTALVSKTSTYPGPHKKYEYWYTGKNTNVISYEQNYNNLYFLTGVGNSPNESSPPVPKVDKPQPSNQTGSQNKAAEAVNALAVDLYDPGSQVMAKMTILGDPDYLSQTVGASIDSVFEKFYGPDGFTLNANGGQVFVELDFKTAEDYDSGTNPEVPAGTLSINDKIRFYNYDPSVGDSIKGITFELKWVTSTFSKGKFTQELDMYATNLAQFAKENKTKEPDSANRNEQGSKSKSKTGQGTTLDPVKAAKARTEFAATDPRRLDMSEWQKAGGKENETTGAAWGNPNLTKQAARARANMQKQDDDNSSSGSPSAPMYEGQREDRGSAEGKAARIAEAKARRDAEIANAREQSNRARQSQQQILNGG